jgi:hypothetical protein
VNDAFVLEASRRADAAHRLMTSLAEATFPDDHPSLAQVVCILLELEVRVRKWCESPKWSQRFALSRTDTSRACRYREIFQQLFALLDRALQEVMSAVQIESFSNLSELRADYEAEAASLNHEFVAAAADGEQSASQAEALETLGEEEGASLDDLLAASRAQADTLAEMKSHLDSTLEGLKADLAAGTQAAQAAAKAAAAVAEALQEHGSSGGGGGGGGAAHNTDEIVDDLLAASSAPLDSRALLKSQLGSILEVLKADLALAAAKAGSAMANAMQMHGSSGGAAAAASGGGGAADNTNKVVDTTIVNALKANVLKHAVPEFLDSLEAKYKLTRTAANNSNGAVKDETLKALSKSTGEEMAKQFVYDPYDSDDDHSGAILGYGCFGETYRMVNKNDMCTYAVKLVNAKKYKLITTGLKHETDVLMQLDHPNIVRYHSSFYYGKRDKYWALAIEYLTGGSLSIKMKSSPEPVRSLRWVLQIASALAHMHEKCLQHRDLKPDNVLLASEAPDAPAVIIDFDLASLNLSKSTASSGVGAFLYRSPEKALGERYGPPDDVWSLGLITAGLALGQPLEDWSEARGGGSGHLALDRSKVDEFLAEAVASCPSLGNLAAALLIQDATLRPTAAAVAESEGNVAALARPTIP